MAVKIRLRRVGAKKQPAYRVVVADARAPRDGRIIESIGHYNPLTTVATVVIDRDRALYWLRNGAQPSDVVQKMLVAQGIWAEFTGIAPAYVPPAPVEEVAPVVVVEEVAPVEEVAEIAVVEEPIEEAAPAEEVVAVAEEVAPAEEVAEVAAEEVAPAEEVVEVAAEPTEETPEA